MATGTIGAKIVLEGEAQYRKALRDIKTEQTQLRSEMKLCQSEFARSQNSLEALTKKHEVLSRQMDASAKKVEVYQKALQTSTEREAKSKQKVDELTKTLEKLEAEQKTMAESSETNAEAMKAQEEAIEKTRRELEVANSDYEKATDQTKKYQTQLNLAEAEMNDLNNALKDNDKYLEEAKNSSDGCATSIDELGKQTKETEEDVNTFGDVLKANLASEVITEGLKMLVEGIKEIASACIESGSQFEASMSNVQALSGATNAELDKMANKAKELGASTIYSASEVADAMSYMSLAGWNTEQTLAGIDSVLNLAASASMDLAQASDILTDYLTAFGLSAEDASEFADMMAYTMAHSNTTVEMLGESYKNCAATATSMGYAVEDVTAVLATMANAGVKGGEAGTALNTIMTRLATNTKGCADTLKGYGVAIYDSEGNMNSLSSILEGLGEVWGTLSDQEQAALAKSIAGTNQYSALQTIMNGLSESAKESGMSFNDYREALEDCTGSAEDMAKVMQDNLQGKVTALDSAMEGLKIATYEIFSENLKRGVESATGAVSRLTKSVSSGALNVSLSKLSKSSGELITKVADWTEKNLPKMIDGLAKVIDHADDIAIALKTIIASFIAFKTASLAVGAVTTAMTAYKSITEGATIAQAALNVVANANPFVLLATAIVGVSTAFVGFANKAKEANKILDETNEKSQEIIDSSSEVINSIAKNREEFEKTTESFDAQKKVTKDLVDRLEEMQEAYKHGKVGISDVQEVIDELNQIYPSLNLSIDKNTGVLSQNTDEILKNADALLKQAKVEAAQEDLAKISKDRYEAEKQLAILRQQEAEAYANYQEKWAKYEEVSNAGIFSGDMWNELFTGANSDAADEAYAKWKMLQEQIEAIEGEGGTLDQLAEQYDYAMGIVEEGNPIIEEAVETFEELEEPFGNVIELSEEASEAIKGMYDSVSKSITGQMDLFSEWEEKDKIASESLVKNLDSQVSALEEWATNMENLSERGIDEGLYKKLAEMGPEGANYVKAFVDMTDEELAKYSEKFADAIKLEDSVAQQITTDYAEVAGYIVDGIELGLNDDGSVTAIIGDLSEDMIEKFKDILGIGDDGKSEVYYNYAKAIPDAMTEGISAQEQGVIDELGKLADGVTKTTEEKLNEATFNLVGTQIGNGIIKGIEDKEGEVYEAVKKLCLGILGTTEETLDIHSPSRKFEWFGKMSGEGFEVGLADSMTDVGSIITGAMQDVSNTGLVASSKSNAIGQLVDLLGRYLPEIAEADSNVQVTLEGDAKGLFNVVQSQNNVYKRSTGRSAFA